MHGIPFPIRRALALALTLSTVAAPATAATPSRGTAYLSSIGGTLFRTSYYFDGATLTVSSATPSVATVRGGGAVRLPDHRVVVVGAGNVSLYDPIAHTLELASSMTNANTATFDPNGTRLWVGWKDTPLSEIPLNPFGNGTPHSITGDDSVATTIAFTPQNGVFYSTGGDAENGNFGAIDLGTFVTTRACTQCFATSVTYDSFTGHLILAGIGHASQRDPAAPETEIASRDDSAAGENYLYLLPTGDGHLVGTRSGSGGLVIIDYSASGRLDDASTVIAFAPTPEIGDLSGEAAVESDLIFPDSFESF